MKKPRWLLLLLVLGLGGYWLIPIPGQVAFLPADLREAVAWPQMRMEPVSPIPGQQATMYITDTGPWANLALLVDGKHARLEGNAQNTGVGIDTWTWRWTFIAPQSASYEVILYYNCDTGCVERARMAVGPGRAKAPSPADLVPTKLGVVFANPARDWHGRSGWDVELTYAMKDQDYWQFDALAERVQRAARNGLYVLVRVDYDEQQTLPPAGDQIALGAYLRHIRRLARDARFQAVYGYLIGSGYNTNGSNVKAPDKPLTPEWYARVFNGYGVEASHTDNVVQIVHAENPHAKVLVGPVRPWSADQDGTQRYAIDMPWLNYMNTLVAELDESTRAKAAAGIPLSGPDGFALHVPGRTDAAELSTRGAAEEPLVDLRRPEWGKAQAGFRVYRDWLAIINSYPTTRGLPAYITSTNTFAPGMESPPAQSYPKGWLTKALAEVNQEPQVLALCWFIDDAPAFGSQWDLFSLSLRSGQLSYAAEEFDALLRSQP